MRAHPLIFFRIGSRPERLAAAEVVVASQGGCDLDVSIPEQGAIVVSQLRVTNGDPRGVVPDVGPVEGSVGERVEWVDGADGVPCSAHIGGWSEVVVTSSGVPPFTVRVDGGRMSAIAERVQISAARPVDVVRGVS